MINQIILSCNEDPIYMDFWKPVSWAYKKMLPECTIHLAFLTNREFDDPVVTDFRQYGRVTLFKPVEGIAEFGQAKMARFVLASEQGNDVCYIDDIDLFPLRKEFITDKTNKRPEGVLLCVGGEVYAFNGCYPISQMTAEGYIWKKFINPGNLTFKEVILSLKDQAMFDHRENIHIPLDFDKDQYFSDERLLKRLIFYNPVPKLELQRGYSNYLESTIDRHTFNKDADIWEFDIEKLNNHGYFNAHCLRPYLVHKEKFEPLMNYINKNY